MLTFAIWQRARDGKIRTLFMREDYTKEDVETDYMNEGDIFLGIISVSGKSSDLLSKLCEFGDANNVDDTIDLAIADLVGDAFDLGMKSVALSIPLNPSVSHDPPSPR